MSEDRQNAIGELADEYAFIKTVERGDDELDENIIEFSSREAKEAFQAGWELRRMESRAIPRMAFNDLLEQWQKTGYGEGSFSMAAEELEEFLKTYDE